MAIYIAPSLLAANFLCLGEELARVKDAGADMVHFDIMDGHFVSNVSFGIPVLESIGRSAAPVPFDIHLMTDKPMAMTDVYLRPEVCQVTFHLETDDPTLLLIEKIHNTGKAAGLSLRPGTPVERLEPYLPVLDNVLIMTVEPGFGGQTFMPEMLPKLEWLARQRREKNYSYAIQVDGGINAQTAPLVLQAGADSLVSGSYLFHAKDMAAAVSVLRTGSRTDCQAVSRPDLLAAGGK